MTSAERQQMRARHDTRMDRPLRFRDHAWDTQEDERIRTAERKARYGHRDWLYWVDRSGTLHVERKSVQSLKQALLDSGTNHYFVEIGANTAVRFICSWTIGLNMLRWQRRYERDGHI
jgi:hypothetical protein